MRQPYYGEDGQLANSRNATQIDVHGTHPPRDARHIVLGGSFPPDPSSNNAFVGGPAMIQFFSVFLATLVTSPLALAALEQIAKLAHAPFGAHLPTLLRMGASKR